MSTIGSITPLDAADRAEPASGFGGMSSADFIRIMFTERANQDPFSPNDSSALLEQLNSIRSIESDINLMAKLDALVFENKLAGASSMIGRFVEGRNLTNDHVQGIVVAVSRSGDEVMLELDNGWRVPVERVETIVG